MRQVNGIGVIAEVSDVRRNLSQMATEGFWEDEIFVRVGKPLAGFRQKLTELAPNWFRPKLFNYLISLFEACPQHAGEAKHAELFVRSVIGDQKNVQTRFQEKDEALLVTGVVAEVLVSCETRLIRVAAKQRPAPKAVNPSVVGCPIWPMRSSGPAAPNSRTGRVLPWA